MISLLIAFAVLIAGYFLYGRVADRIFASDDRQTPAIANNDGVDCVPMKTWKAFLVQLLNIAGTGPIFGAQPSVGQIGDRSKVNGTVKKTLGEKTSGVLLFIGFLEYNYLPFSVLKSIRRVPPRSSVAPLRAMATSTVNRRSRFFSLV